MRLGWTPPPADKSSALTAASPGQTAARFGGWPLGHELWPFIQNRLAYRILDPVAPPKSKRILELQGQWFARHWTSGRVERPEVIVGSDRDRLTQKFFGHSP
jgi:hypothetical protein